MSAPVLSANTTICAWCRHLCIDHMPVRRLTDAEYEQVESHGICIPCKETNLATFRPERAGKVGV